MKPDIQDTYDELLEIAHTLSDIAAASAVLDWDQEVMMPPKGGEGRAHQVATLAAVHHEKLTAPRTGDLLARLTDAMAGDGDYSIVERAFVREMQRQFDQAVKVPPLLVRQLAEAASRGVEIWRQARANNDFATFAPALRHTYDLKRQLAENLGYTDSPYDPLLDQFEPGMTAAQVQRLFDPLRDQTRDLLARINAAPQVDISIIEGNWDVQKQWDFGIQVLRDMGYDFDAGRQDLSSHPFTTSFTAPFDVRVTTRVFPHLLTSGLFSTIHEGGHALYELGFDPALARTPLADSPGLAMHESQSRLWENYIGRGRPFWQHYFPILMGTFPDQLRADDFERFYLAVNRVEPSLIRVEADEVTYNLHVILRFELERALLEGNIQVEDLPEAWNAKMGEYIGATPPTDANGVMQDIHWPSGLVGYFPTYSLGNLIGAQLYYTLRDTYADFDDRLAAGDMGFILAWLRENVHRYGRIYSTNELVQRATGKPLDESYFARYLGEKYGPIYGLEPQ
ncbi:MAG: carboxypeptidase M32 [Anaerolineae bacterium]